MMSQQLDLRHEADNLLTFEKNFSHRNVAVTFPRPLRAWSTKELLVEEYEMALPLEAFLKNGGGPFDEQVATMGLDAFLVSRSFLSYLCSFDSSAFFRICYCSTISFIPTCILVTSW
jgi:hypothetical protein